MMIFKKCTSLILLCTMLMSFFALAPLTVSADGGNVDTSLYGISVDAAYQSFVVVLPESIGVFSTTNDEISSADLASAITAPGYTVSYADKNGGEDVTTDGIYGGYVKLTPSSGGDAVYIPVSLKAPLNDTSFDTMTSPGTVQNVTYSASGTPVGGKLTPSHTFTVTDTPSGTTALKSSSLLKYNSSLPTVWTYEFNMYADGDAVPMISLKYANDNGGYTSLKWLADGTLSGYRGAQNTVFNFGTMERGKWHRVAISFIGATGGNLANGRYNLYVDGEYVNNMYNYGCRYANDHMFFSVHPASGAGTVAFDDLDAFAGAYDSVPFNTAMQSLTLESTNAAVEITDDNTIIVDTSVVGNIDALIDVLSTSADSVKVYDDISCRLEAVSFSDKSVLVLSNSDNNVFRYYTLALTVMTVKSVEKAPSGTENVYDILATLSYSASHGKDVTMVVLVYDNEGRFEKMFYTETDSVVGDVNFEVKNVTLGNKKLEILFIDNWESCIPYFENMTVE